MKNPEKTKTFNCLFANSKPVLLKKWADPLPPHSLTTLSHDRRPVSRFYVPPWRKNPLSVSIHTEDKFAKGNAWQSFKCPLSGGVDNAILQLDHGGVYTAVSLM